MNTRNNKLTDERARLGFLDFTLTRPAVLAGFLTLLMTCFPSVEYAQAADDPEDADESTGELVKGLFGMIMSETKKRGRIKKIEVVENRGNSITLEVSYDKIKLPTDVHLTAEVTHRGKRLEGFYSTVADADHKKGEEQITITWNNTQQGIEQESDQINVILFRGDDPGDSMSAKKFPLVKVWTTSTQADRESVTVPKLVGMSLDEALAALEKEGLERGSVTEEISGSVAAGTVRLQDPDAEVKLEKDKLAPVNLVVEAFSIQVPDLKNKTVIQAEAALVSAGLALGEVTESRTRKYTGGTVIDSKPSAGERVPPEGAVAITVETKSVQIPSVTGQTLSEAHKTLTTLGLRIRQIKQRKTGAQSGVVLSQMPAPGTQATPGSRIVLVIEKQTVTVPNVMRHNLFYAKRKLDAAHLKVRVFKKRTGRNKANVVLRQTPTATAKVAPGSVVTLVVEAKPLPAFKITSRGNLTVKQTWTADLDTGKTGGSVDADIWFQAKTAKARYITPRNGARIAKVGRRSKGLTGCQKTRLYTAPISIQALPAGTYLCARTNKGQYSEFRVVSTVGPSSGTFKIRYTTWGIPSAQKSVALPKTILTAPALQKIKVHQRAVAPAE